MSYRPLTPGEYHSRSDPAMEIKAMAHLIRTQINNMITDISHQGFLRNELHEILTRQQPHYLKLNNLKLFGLYYGLITDEPKPELKQIKKIKKEDPTNDSK